MTTFNPEQAESKPPAKRPFEIPRLTAGMFTSRTDEWETPKALFDRLSLSHGPLALDVCATPKNAKCARFFSKEDDGLTQDWNEAFWMNPPYGRVIGKWVKKAAESKPRGVCLLPARTDTAWWHDYVLPTGQVEFLRGRVHFNGTGPAPFPSAVVVYR